jgi:hypothetical protein
MDERPTFETFRDRKLENPAIRAGYDEAKARRDAPEASPVTRAVPGLAAVLTLHNGTHWCFNADEQPVVYEPGTEWWPCPTLAALPEALTQTAAPDLGPESNDSHAWLGSDR